MRGFFSSSSSLFSRAFFRSRRTLAHEFSNHDRHRPLINARYFSGDPSQTSACLRPGPLARYRSMVREGKLKYDTYQERVAFELEELLGKLQCYQKEMEDYHVKLATWEKNRENERRKLLLEEAELKQKDGVWIDTKNRKSSFIDKWISRRRRRQNVEPGVGKMVSYFNREKKLDSVVGVQPVPPTAPKGLYLYGNVGSGKTMLMDMFYSATKGIVKHRRRFHFHELFAQRTKAKAKGKAIASIAPLERIELSDETPSQSHSTTRSVQRYDSDVDNSASTNDGGDVRESVVMSTQFNSGASIEEQYFIHVTQDSDHGARRDTGQVYARKGKGKLVDDFEHM